MTHLDPPERAAAAVPPLSRRSNPRVAGARKTELASAFLTQGSRYEQLRPGYPPQIIDRICAAGAQVSGGAPVRVVDVGAGTGKLSLDLARAGCEVFAVDPSAQMLSVAAAASRQAETEPGCGAVHTVQAYAEDTGLAAGCAHVVCAAQAWHWFDAEAASAEAQRLLTSGGVVALVWNTLDVRVPWVHRYARIAHSGDVQRDGFEPTVAQGWTLKDRCVHRWVDARSRDDVIALASTRSYWMTASQSQRARVLENLHWYVGEHLGHGPDSVIEMPYRSDLFVYDVG